MRIGCTVACSKSLVDALNAAAQPMGMRVEISTIATSASGHYATELSRLDGILSPGGHDIAPRYYDWQTDSATRARLEAEHRRFGNGGERSPDFGRPEYAARDKHEFDLMSRYFRSKALSSTPLLGVCYGMQMMAASRGIPLYVDISQDLHLPPRLYQDAISLSDDAPEPIRKALGSGFAAAKNHHQAVDLEYLKAHADRYPTSKIVATSNNGKIAEMIEMTDRPALGIQFHAERSDPKVSNAVFGWFLEKACERASTREPKKPASRG